MEAVAAKGLARKIGVSNFNSAQVDRIMDKAKFKPVVNQVRLKCYDHCVNLRLLFFEFHPIIRI